MLICSQERIALNMGLTRLEAYGQKFGAWHLDDPVADVRWACPVKPTPEDLLEMQELVDRLHSLSERVYTPVPGAHNWGLWRAIQDTRFYQQQESEVAEAARREQAAYVNQAGWESPQGHQAIPLAVVDPSTSEQERIAAQFELRVICPNGHGTCAVGGATDNMLRLACGCWLQYIGGSRAWWVTLPSPNEKADR